MSRDFTLPPWLLACLALALAMALTLTLSLVGPAAAQEAEQEDAAGSSEQSESPVEFDPAICDEPPAEGELLPTECAELAGEGPKDQVDAGEMRATMRRFVPSEQISEDSSVAFPNDI